MPQENVAILQWKKKLVIKLFTILSQLYKKVYNIHIGIHRGKSC